MINFNIATAENIINNSWDSLAHLVFDEKLNDTIIQTLKLLDEGMIRVAEKKSGNWHLNQWIKKAIILSFRMNSNAIITGAPENSCWYDKVFPKFLNWDEEKFKQQALRVVPGTIVRYSAFIAKNVVLMPSFLNVGCYIDENTMIDSYATIASCVQVGKNCHISSGVVLAGVLEPIQSSPVIIEDNCFIGANSVIAEGVIIEEGSVIAMGVNIGSATKILDRATGEIIYGRVPACSVVVPGVLKDENEHHASLAAAIIVKKVDMKTRLKTTINDLLRL